MKGNPTAGIILLLAASLFIALGTKYRERVKGAWNVLISGTAGTVPDSTPTTGGGNLKLPDNSTGGNIGNQGGVNS